MEENHALRFFAKIIFSVGISYLGWKIFEKIGSGYGPIGLMLTSMIWVRLFPRDILNLFSFVKNQAQHAAVFRWHGKYYSFDGRQIRFYLIENIVWIPFADIERIVEPKIVKHELTLLAQQYGKIPEHSMQGVTEEGLMRLLKTRTEGGHTNYKMIRFKRWLLTSALENVKRLPKSAIRNIR